MAGTGRGGASMLGAIARWKITSPHTQICMTGNAFVQLTMTCASCLQWWFGCMRGDGNVNFSLRLVWSKWLDRARENSREVGVDLADLGH